MNYLQQATDPDGWVVPEKLSKLLYMSMEELAFMTANTVEILKSVDCYSATPVQTNLKTMVVVIERITPWAGTVSQAVVWFRNEPISSVW